MVHALALPDPPAVVAASRRFSRDETNQAKGKTGAEARVPGGRRRIRTGALYANQKRQ
jgi:hypothetical protein